MIFLTMVFSLGTSGGSPESAFINRDTHPRAGQREGLFSGFSLVTVRLTAKCGTRDPRFLLPRMATGLRGQL